MRKMLLDNINVILEAKIYKQKVIGNEVETQQTDQWSIGHKVCILIYWITLLSINNITLFIFVTMINKLNESLMGYNLLYHGQYIIVSL